MDIAIIGMSCKFPEAENYERFWENLIQKKSSITEVPEFRWSWKEFWGDPKTDVNKTQSKWAGFVKDVDAFDASFFSLLPKVVKTMDPQQRIMLELAWHCLEDAGVAPSTLRGRNVGVICGAFNHDYKELQESGSLEIEAHHSTGTASSIIANRISHFFDFKGPSLPVDTACSSSLNAIHNAIQAIEYGDCEMALAGGINLILTPTRHISFSKMGMLSPSGASKTFDDSADGYVRGEGAGLVLLKPLTQAIADGDAIHGVIKGSAVNHCGETYTLTYPSAQAQADVVAKAIERAGISLEAITYIETHGTGTPKGDPIEFQGLNKAFASVAEKQKIKLANNYCALGAVKTNIGHLEAAAGIAGLIKILLAMRNKELPALQNFKSLNKRIDIENTPFYMLDDKRAWLPSGSKGYSQRELGNMSRCAGVSSFGFGGTNAHVILQEYRAKSKTKVTNKNVKQYAYLIVLSAKSEHSLAKNRTSLLDWIRANKKSIDILDLSAGLLKGRDHFTCRCAYVVEDIDSLISCLDSSEVNDAVRVVNSDDLNLQKKSSQQADEILATLKAKKNRKTKASVLKSLRTLRDCYLLGANSKWASLFSDLDVKRLHLPLYQFEKQRFWVEVKSGIKHSSIGQIHPLVHENISDLEQQRYRSRFSGEEFFLRDHKVNSRKVLPAAAFIEIAYTALSMSTPPTRECDKKIDVIPEGSSAVSIDKLIFMRPFWIEDSARELQIKVYPDIDQQQAAKGNEFPIQFDIVSGGENNAMTVNSQGQACLIQLDTTEKNSVVQIELPIEIEGEAWTPYQAEPVYAWMSELGLQYGHTHQVIKQLWASDEYLVAEISLPTILKKNAAQFRSHPAIIDGALQLGVILLGGFTRSCDVGAKRLFLPFSIDQVQLFCQTSTNCWVVVRPDETEKQKNGKLEIFVLAERPVKGKPLNMVARIKGLLYREFVDVQNNGVILERSEHPQSKATEVDESYYSSMWREKPCRRESQIATLEKILLVGEKRLVAQIRESLESQDIFSSVKLISVVLSDSYHRESETYFRLGFDNEDDYLRLIADLKEDGGLPESIIFVHSDEAFEILNSKKDSDEGEILRDSNAVFLLVKSYFKPVKKARFISLVSRREHDPVPLYQGLSGFYKTVKLEKPNFNGRVVVCDFASKARSKDTSYLSEILFDELVSNEIDVDIAYEDNKRFVREFFPLSDKEVFQAKDGVMLLGSERDYEKKNNEKTTGFRVGAVYLVTGGMGALGLLVAKHLISQYQAHVYLTGRSDAKQEKLSELEGLTADGGSVAYLKGDVSSYKSTRAMVEQIIKNGHTLNGVIHSAGVIEDNFIIRKTFDAYKRVVAPKVKGSYFLDLATQDQPIELFILFSSVTGIFGNLGQCDYGYGNAFEDYFSHYRNCLALRNKRSGKAVSINWPYWKEGGMLLSEQEEQILQRNFGITPLSHKNGIRALEFAVNQGMGQMAVLEGDQTKIREILGVRAQESSKLPYDDSQINIDTPQTDGEKQIKDKVIDFLIDTFSKKLDLPKNRFELHSSFQSFGFDSVVMIDMVNILEKSLPGLPKTLFFEYQSIDELADFIAKDFGNHFNLSTSTRNITHNIVLEQPVATNSIEKRKKHRFFNRPLHTTKTHTREFDDDIVIVGIAGRYPQARDLSEYWDNLKSGRDSVTMVPEERNWNMDKLFKPGTPEIGYSYGKWGGFIDDIDKFDPLFFSISPKETEEMDPHIRLFLETVSLAINDAGYRPEKLAKPRDHSENPVGVYAGIMWGDYHLYGMDGAGLSEIASPNSFYWAVANRVSYQFNFSGPSLTIDTACSSSISAIHLACEAIKSGEIDVGIAGGVNLSLHPMKYAQLAHLRFLSTDGRCRSFGVGGDGYVPAEAVGAAILKRKSDALRDGDHIYGVIKSTAVNHGGRTSGFTVPNPNRQASLIKDAIAKAEIDARHISYVEAHGTGTGLGDPIEIAGLSKAFSQNETQYCAIGSAKSNIGHAEAAAGMAGLSKILLQIKHKKIAPSLHSSELNPYAKLDQSPFVVQQELGEWHAPELHDKESDQFHELPRIAALSSFGAGGANGHLIVEEFTEQEKIRAKRRDANDRQAKPFIVLLSAKKDVSLRDMAVSLKGFIKREENIELVDLAYTLQVGRVPMEYGLAIVTTNLQDLSVKLSQFISGTNNREVRSAKRQKGKASEHALAAKGLSLNEVDRAIQQKRYNELIDYWLAGIDVAWEKLYQNGEAFRIPLPGYVFDKQRYWVEHAPLNKTHPLAKSLHPLVDQNISTLDEQRFIKRFSNNEFYLNDHRLGESAVLPGVAYLEMAVQAANFAGRSSIVGLSDIQWLKPIIVADKSETVYTGIYVNGDELEFDIYDEERPHEQRLFSTGKLILSNEETSVYQNAHWESVRDSIDSLKSSTLSLQYAEINQAFKQLGFSFGRSFHVIQSLKYNDTEALSELNLLPEYVDDRFILHPAVLDGVLRTAIGIDGFSSQTKGLPLPVSLDKITIFRTLPSNCLVCARLQAGNTKQSARSSYDIDVVTLGGEPVVSLVGFTIQRVAHLRGISSKKAKESLALTKSPSQYEVKVSSSAYDAKQISFEDNAQGASYQDAVKAYLISVVSEVTKVPTAEIDTALALENYGINSVMILGMNEKLNAIFDELSQTLFFEYQNIDELSEYLADNHAEGKEKLDAKSVIKSTKAPLIKEPLVVEEGAAKGATKGSNASAINTPINTLSNMFDNSSLSSDSAKADTSLLAMEFLIDLVSSVTKVVPENIDIDEALENYGVESVMVMTMNERIETLFGSDVSKTLFYEYLDIRSLAEYFVENYEPQLLSLFSKKSPGFAGVIQEPGEASTTKKRVIETEGGVRTKIENGFANNRNVQHRDNEEVEKGTRLTSDHEKRYLELVKAICQLFIQNLHMDTSLDIARDSLSSLPIDYISGAKINCLLAQHYSSLGLHSIYQYESIHDIVVAITGFNPDKFTPSSVVKQPSSTQRPVRRAQRFSGGSTPHEHRPQEHKPMDFAIVGLAGRYPQAETLEDYWQNILMGKDCIIEVPDDRWDSERLYSEDRNEKGKVYSKWGGFIENVGHFDPEFFRITPREAEKIDPQERLFLQTSWECIEDAAYTKAQLQQQSVGVFVGVMWGLYQHIDIADEQVKYGKPSSAFSSIPNRVSYTFNLNGPSIAMDTMCSSSISAIHAACQSIRSGDCDVAIAGGVNLATHGIKYELLCQEQFLSTDGRCRTFGEGGDGYVPGEGVGAVMIKPLSKALDDGDHLYGIIKASSLNHGGKTNGYTVPNQRAQTSVISKALERAEWPVESLSYIEAHGTGTSLGDPIEIAGLSKALENVNNAPLPIDYKCDIGSIKANTGHLESAAGIAGITKVLLQFKYKSIPPSIHSSTLNKNINFESTPLIVPQEAKEWQRTAIKGGDTYYPRRAGVSSFGAGGSNAHILLEEYDEQNAFRISDFDSHPVLFLVSANSEQRLKRYIARLIAYLDKHISGDIIDDRLRLHRLAYTSQVGREVCGERVAIITTSLSELRDKLESLILSSEEKLARPKMSDGIYLANHVENRTELADIFDKETQELIVNSVIVNAAQSEKTQPKIHWKRLAKMWVAGVNISWETIREALYPAIKTFGRSYLHKLSYPTTPFICDRYWVKEKREDTISSKLHPLIDENISTLSEQCYSKIFTGKEFYLKDHVIRVDEDKVILPGVAYLEMAKQAGELAAGKHYSVNKIKNVLWLSPIEINDSPEKIHIRIAHGENSIDYEVVHADDYEKVYSQGELCYTSGEQNVENTDEWLDLDKIKSSALSIENKGKIYREFADMGFAYGPSYQITEKQYLLENAALCELVLPDTLLHSQEDYFIHPSLMDAALRSGLAASFGLARASEMPRVPIVPFGLEELELRFPLTSRCFAYATRSQAQFEQHESENGVKKYDIVVVDESGLILVKLRNFMAKPLVRPVLQEASERVNTETDIGTQLFGFEWREKGILDLEKKGKKERECKKVLMIHGTNPNFYDAFVNLEKGVFADTLVNHIHLNCHSNECGSKYGNKYGTLGSDDTAFNITYELNELDALKNDFVKVLKALQKREALPDLVLLNIAGQAPTQNNSAQENLVNNNKALSQPLHIIAQLFKAFEAVSPTAKYHCIYSFERDASLESCVSEAVSGFTKSLVGVNHRFSMQCISWEGPVSSETISKKLTDEIYLTSSDTVPNNPSTEVHYHDTRRFERVVCPVLKPAKQLPESLLRKGACYLISGGLGKLGLVFARYLAKHYQARLILTGRSSLNPEKQKEIDELIKLGAQVSYIVVDVCDSDALSKALHVELHKLFAQANTPGVLNGVIHSAGVATSDTLLDQTAEDFDRILAPKLVGTLTLDSVTKDHPLDFFITFSSISAVVGDLGSGSYACANRFMDAFVQRRTQVVMQGVGSGLSLSINWPLWLQGGMEIPEEEKAFFNFSGIAPLDEKDGLRAFEGMLTFANTQILVASGNIQKFGRYLKMDANDIEGLVSRNEPKLSVEEQRSVGTSEEISKDKKKIDVRPRVNENTAPSESAYITDNGDVLACHTFLKQKLSEIINVKVASICIDSSFESYGMDSVMLMELQNSLKQYVKKLPKTALFEYDTISKLSIYLTTQFSDELGDELKLLRIGNSQASKSTHNSIANRYQQSETKTDSPTQLPISAKTRYFASSATYPIKTGNKLEILDEDIAIIGIGGRFPKTKSMTDFWELISKGENIVETIPSDRWDAEAYYSSKKITPSNKTKSKWGGFLEDVDDFDYEFFKMSFDEATKLDPQVKIVLESAWCTLEDAGYTPSSIRELSVGVFVGSMSDDFTRLTADLIRETDEYLGPGYVASEIANRLSFFMDLHGPSLTVQTACSSSSTALHLARTSILNGECDYAFAGGVNLSLHPGKYLMLDDMKVLSPSGIEQAFDDQADGLVPCEGAGMVLLKRYGQALKDGDNIYGVIKASNISHSGVGAGQFIPNIKVMEDTAVNAIQHSGINVGDIQYIECHGTGTELGDPIELKALENAFQRLAVSQQVERAPYCALGTKANFGHMEAASGICSLIKVLLCMKNHSFAPCANLSNINASFDSEKSVFYFPNKADSWNPGNNKPFIAGINSFGMGGSNAFMLLSSEQKENCKGSQLESVPTEPNEVVVLFSAKTDDQLKILVKRYCEHFNHLDEKTRLIDIAYTTQVGRVEHEKRLAIVATTKQDFLVHAENYLKGQVSKKSFFEGDTKDARAELILNLLVNEHGSAFTDALIKEHMLGKLASIWVWGAKIDWTRLYTGNDVKRVSLPTYPFKRIDTHIENFSKLKANSNSTKEKVEVKTSVQTPNKSKSNGESAEFTPETGVWYIAERDKIDIKELLVGSQLEIADQLFEGSVDWKYQYWIETVNGASDSYQLFDSHTREKPLDSCNYYKSEMLIEGTLLNTVQAFTQRYQIELDTLLVAAWSLLIGRLNKKHFAQFSYLDNRLSTDRSEPVQPFRIKTIGRQSAIQWLENIQIERFIKAKAVSAIMDEGKHKSGTALPQQISEVSWDTLISRSLSPDMEFTPLAPKLGSALIHAQLHIKERSDAFSICLYTLHEEIYSKRAMEILEYIVGFIEGLVRHPDRNPAALPMQTKKEYREKFWKKFESSSNSNGNQKSEANQ